MPECKKDPTKKYKGTEPSPKGRGFCAHSEDIGKKMKGLDGNMWEIKATTAGVKRWVKCSVDKKSSSKNKKPKNLSSEPKKCTDGLYRFRMEFDIEFKLGNPDTGDIKSNITSSDQKKVAKWYKKPYENPGLYEHLNCSLPKITLGLKTNIIHIITKCTSKNKLMYEPEMIADPDEEMNYTLKIGGTEYGVYGKYKNLSVTYLNK